MNLNILKDVELWNQSYNFDYNCMGVNAFILRDIALFLQTQGITKTIKEINQFYNNGYLYELPLEEKQQKCQELLGIDYLILPSKYQTITYSIAYGNYDIILKSDSFQKEFKKYIQSLINEMPKYHLFAPNIENLDLHFLAKFFLKLTDIDPKNSISFDSYINSIPNNTFQQLSIISKIDRTSLKNPLLYKFIIKCNANIKKSQLSNETLIFINEFRSLWVELDNSSKQVA